MDIENIILEINAYNEKLQSSTLNFCFIWKIICNSVTILVATFLLCMRIIFQNYYKDIFEKILFFNVSRYYHLIVSNNVVYMYLNMGRQSVYVYILGGPCTSIFFP